MRRIDIDRLSKPYTEDTNVPIPEPSSALGVATPKWKQLELTILEGLNTEAPYSVRVVGTASGYLSAHTDQ